jgi:uncharacterized protein YbcI
MEPTSSADRGTHAGEELAGVTNGIVRLFSEYYGRGPTKAKSYLLDDKIVVCVLENTMTTVERTLCAAGNGAMVREVRLTFQEAMADSFMSTVSEAMGQPVLSYHSQLLLEPDVGVEFFVLGD